MVNAISFDAVADELSIVINASDLPAGASIGGQDFNFVDGHYVFKGTLNPDGSISGLEGLVLIPPRDFAGILLPITFVTTDTQSGDEKTLTAQVPVAISPVADVPSSSGDQPLDNHVTPSITLNVQKRWDWMRTINRPIWRTIPQRKTVSPMKMALCIST